MKFTSSSLLHRSEAKKRECCFDKSIKDKRGHNLNLLCRSKIFDVNPRDNRRITPDILMLSYYQIYAVLREQLIRGLDPII